MSSARCPWSLELICSPSSSTDADAAWCTALSRPFEARNCIATHVSAKLAALTCRGHTQQIHRERMELMAPLPYHFAFKGRHWVRDTPSTTVHWHGGNLHANKSAFKSHLAHCCTSLGPRCTKSVRIPRWSNFGAYQPSICDTTFTCTYMLFSSVAVELETSPQYSTF